MKNMPCNSFFFFFFHSVCRNQSDTPVCIINFPPGLLGESDIPSELLLVTRSNDNHSPGTGDTFK